MSERITRHTHLNQQGFGLISTLISLIFGIITTLLVLRFIFMLFAVNSLNGFVSWVYSASQPFVAPFAGIFQNTTIFSGRIEMKTLIALVVFAVVGSILSRLFAGSYRPHPA